MRAVAGRTWQIGKRFRLSQAEAINAYGGCGPQEGNPELLLLISSLWTRERGELTDNNSIFIAEER